MAYHWSDYRGLLAQRIRETGVMIQGYNNPEDAVDDLISKASASTPGGTDRTPAENFVLNYDPRFLADKLTELGFEVGAVHRDHELTAPER